MCLLSFGRYALRAVHPLRHDGGATALRPSRRRMSCSRQGRPQSIHHLFCHAASLPATLRCCARARKQLFEPLLQISDLRAAGSLYGFLTKDTASRISAECPCRGVRALALNSSATQGRPPSRVFGIDRDTMPNAFASYFLCITRRDQRAHLGSQWLPHGSGAGSSLLGCWQRPHVRKRPPAPPWQETRGMKVDRHRSRQTEEITSSTCPAAIKSLATFSKFCHQHIR